MSLISQKAAVSQFSTQIVTLLSRNPRAIVVASLTALLFPWSIRSFREYKALGRGGAPNFCVGWILATLAKPFGRETTSTEEYERDADKETWLKAGGGAQEVPPRGRPRPATSWHFLPHRQVDQFPGDEVKAILVQEFRSVVDANPDLVELQLSPHEKFSDAVVIHSSLKAPHRVAEAALREIVHYHDFKDFSMHVVLSPQDCKLVIEHGWGERHPLSGRMAHLPKEYLFIYAPQSEDDVRVAGLIMRAAVGYMTHTRNVR